ncbi:phosphopyruvate hydratase [Candidatus Gottesmanbacteria bacterium]|nr:phosphopyruvate hydratase [Candidatus Gottesmanbacteria bacterium]
MSKIADITPFEILDSRGNPTIEVEMTSSSGISARASVPSGASKGSHEALEIRDGDEMRFGGLGVLKAIQLIETIIKPKLIGFELGNQKGLDDLLISLDGTRNKGVLGANSILGISLSYARLSAQEGGIPLYVHIASEFRFDPKSSNVTPMFNVINGGLHGSGTIDMQEFLIIPHYTLPFMQKLQMGVELYHSIKKKLHENRKMTSVGDEGGFTPQFYTNNEVLKFLSSSIAPYQNSFHIGLDCAATTYFKQGRYKLIDFKDSSDASLYIQYLEKIIKEFHIVSLEDGLAEDAWTDWAKLTQRVGNSCMIVGDDLLVTNKERLEKAIQSRSCTAILVKVNQVGTLTETYEVIRIAKQAGFRVIISHRSGETTDDFIADLAVGTGADFVKFGAPARGERVAKYNRLFHIYTKLQK